MYKTLNVELFQRAWDGALAHKKSQRRKEGDHEKEFEVELEREETLVDLFDFSGNDGGDYEVEAVQVSDIIMLKDDERPLHQRHQHDHYSRQAEPKHKRIFECWEERVEACLATLLMALSEKEARNPTTRCLKNPETSTSTPPFSIPYLHFVKSFDVQLIRMGLACDAHSDISIKTTLAPSGIPFGNDEDRSSNTTPSFMTEFVQSTPSQVVFVTGKTENGYRIWNQREAVKSLAKGMKNLEELEGLPDLFWGDNQNRHDERWDHEIQVTYEHGLRLETSVPLYSSGDYAGLEWLRPNLSMNLRHLKLEISDFRSLQPLTLPSKLHSNAPQLSLTSLVIQPLSGFARYERHHRIPPLEPSSSDIQGWICLTRFLETQSHTLKRLELKGLRSLVVTSSLSGLDENEGPAISSSFKLWNSPASLLCNTSLNSGPPTNLTHIHLEDCSLLDWSCLLNLPPQSLKSLELIHCDGITDENMVPLLRRCSRSLKVLYLKSTRITEESIMALLEAEVAFDSSTSLSSTSTSTSTLQSNTSLFPNFTSAIVYTCSPLEQLRLHSALQAPLSKTTIETIQQKCRNIKVIELQQVAFSILPLFNLLKSLSNTNSKADTTHSSPILQADTTPKLKHLALSLPTFAPPGSGPMGAITDVLVSVISNQRWDYLTCLDLSGGDITDRGCRQLCEGLGTAPWADQGYLVGSGNGMMLPKLNKRAGGSGGRLESVKLVYCERISMEGLKWLLMINGIKEIDVRRCALISQREVGAVLRECEWLQRKYSKNASKGVYREIDNHDFLISLEDEQKAEMEASLVFSMMQSVGTRVLFL
jgi:hypothetical protein